MITVEDFKKSAMRTALDKVYSWKQEHQEEYSHFSSDINKVMHNDFSCYERIFKMAIKYVPVPVLVECQKLFVPNTDNTLSDDEKTIVAGHIIDDLMELKGYLRFRIYTETFEENVSAFDSNKLFLIREYSISDEDLSDVDDEYLYLPFGTSEELWESLPSLIQMAVFNLGKGHTVDELATISKRIIVSASYTVTDTYTKLRDHILNESNSLLMCILYYICFDHGLPKSALALSKITLGDKQISYMRESIKAVVDKLVETSIAKGFDKKAEWTKLNKEVENTELQQAIKNSLSNTKGKHGRRTFQQEELSIDDILIVDDKQALKKAILAALNNMEHDYETAYIKAALIWSGHLKSNVSFAAFLRAICVFSSKDYKYDPGQRVDSFITYEKKEYETSKNSKWQRARRIVSGLTQTFGMIK